MSSTREQHGSPSGRKKHKSKKSRGSSSRSARATSSDSGRSASKSTASSGGGKKTALFGNSRSRHNRKESVRDLAMADAYRQHDGATRLALLADDFAAAAHEGAAVAEHLAATRLAALCSGFHDAVMLEKPTISVASVSTATLKS